MASFDQPPATSNGSQKPLSRLTKYDNGKYALEVGGSHFLVRGGELAASSMSSATYLSRRLDNLVKSGINTVFGAVSWGNVEPVEGAFDFAELDEIIALLRDKGLHLALQWHGTLVGHSTDNLSDSAPAWVKMNSRRFPRVKRTEDVYDSAQDEIIGKTRRTAEAISLFGDEIAKAEQAAFKALAKHLRTSKHFQDSVILIQIGSSIGFKRQSRDYSDAANVKFEGLAPKDLISHYQAKGSALDPESLHYGWESFCVELEDAEDLFSAYHFACYVEELAAIAKRECDLPVYTDVAINRQGGALHGSAEGARIGLWEAFAPSIDFFAGRILPGCSSESLAAFAANHQPLLVLGQGQSNIGNIWPTIAASGAFGIAVTGMESMDVDTSPVPTHLRFLRDLTPSILAARANDKKVMGFVLNPLNRAFGTGVSAKGIIGDLEVSYERLDGQTHRNGGWGIIIETADTLLIAGEAFQVKAKSLLPRAIMTRVLSFCKKEAKDEGSGGLRTLRRFTAEETNGGRVAQMPATTPMIAEVVFYALEE